MGGITAIGRGSPYTGPTPHPTHLDQSQGQADQTVKAIETFLGIPLCPRPQDPRAFLGSRGCLRNLFTF